MWIMPLHTVQKWYLVLGVTLDTNLRWQYHLQEISSKVSEFDQKGLLVV